MHTQAATARAGGGGVTNLVGEKIAAAVAVLVCNGGGHVLVGIAFQRGGRRASLAFHADCFLILTLPLQCHGVLKSG